MPSLYLAYRAFSSIFVCSRFLYYFFDYHYYYLFFCSCLNIIFLDLFFLVQVLSFRCVFLLCPLFILYRSFLSFLFSCEVFFFSCFSLFYLFHYCFRDTLVLPYIYHTVLFLLSSIILGSYIIFSWFFFVSYLFWCVFLLCPFVILYRSFLFPYRSFLVSCVHSGQSILRNIRRN